MIRYSMMIEWSDEDQAFLVRLPEWNPLPMTHGDTYQEAVQRGEELLGALIESRKEHSEPLPEPRVYASAGQEAR